MELRWVGDGKKLLLHCEIEKAPTLHDGGDDNSDIKRVNKRVEFMAFRYFRLVIVSVGY